MKISEYITKLEAILAREGDLPCYETNGPCDDEIEALGPELREAVAGENLPKRVHV